jgi:hypothetical protein
MLEMLGSALFGGGVGIFGSVVSKVLSIWQFKEELKSKKMDHDHEKSLLDRQLEARKDELESEQAIVNVAADESVRVASYQHANSVGDQRMGEQCASIGEAITDPDDGVFNSVHRCNI